MSPFSRIPVAVIDSCPSTQDLARSLAEKRNADAGAPAAAAFAVVTREQTQGRGRGGSVWVAALGAKASDEGTTSGVSESAPSWLESLPAALASFRDFPPLTLALPAASLAIPPSWVPAATGCAVVDALSQTASFLLSSFPDLPPATAHRGEEPWRLKWPNDVVVREPMGGVRKVAGILCETSVRGEAFSTFLVGIGLNLFAAPTGVDGALSWFGAIFADAQGKKADRSKLSRFLADADARASVMQRFAQNLERELLEYLTVPRANGQLRGLALERSLPVGTILSVNKGTVVGRFLGLTESGALLVEGLAEPLLAGEVTVYDGLASITGGATPSPAAGASAVTPGSATAAPASNTGARGRDESNERNERSDRADRDDRADKPARQKGKNVRPSASARAGADADADRTEGPRPCVILECGNTTIHWEVAVGETPVARGDAGWEEFGRSAKDHRSTPASPISLRRPSDALRPLVMALVDHKRAPVRLAYSSVSDTGRTRRFMSDLEELLRNVFPEIKLSRMEISSASVLEGTPLASRYDLATLGTDRALRFLFCHREAARLGVPVATVGAGTAFTLECVSPDGVILESLIAPGWRMGLEALHEKTARLPPLAPEVRPRPPTGLWSTEDSMQRGAVLPITATVAHLARDTGLARVVVSGGSAQALVEFLAAEKGAEGVILERDEDLERGLLRSLVAGGGVRAGWHLNRACLTEPEGVAESASAGSSAPGVAAPGETSERRPPASPTEDDELDSDDLAPDAFASYRAIDGRAPPEGILRTMLKARLLKTKDLGIEPRREDFRRLGVRIENVGTEGERLDKWLAEKFKFHNRDTWQQRVEGGEVLVQSNASKTAPSHDAPDDGSLRRVKHTYRVKNFDQLWLFHPSEYEPDHIDTCEVDFDDGDTVVFSKPGNLVIHASGLYGKNTFLEVARRMGYADAAPVHRLDRETSGALVCARSSAQRNALSRAFRNGRMKKMYLAVTRPFDAREVPDMFTVAHPIGPAIGSRIRLKLWIDHPDAQDALTHVVRLARHDGFDLFACLPQTGRTNQIRIHLSAVGQWIVGDKMYHPDEEVFLTFYEEGLTPWVHDRVLFPRHLLHNTGIEALDTGESGAPAPTGGIWNSPVVANVTDDMLEYAPLRALLQEAGIPAEREAQSTALLGLFRKCAHDEADRFGAAPCYR